MKDREGRQQRHHGEAISNLNDETPLVPNQTLLVGTLCNSIAQQTPLVSYQTPMAALNSGNINVYYGEAYCCSYPKHKVLSVACLQQSAFASQQNF